MLEVTLFCKRCDDIGEGTSLTVSSCWEASERYNWWENELTREWYCPECTEVIRDQEVERRLK